MTNVEKLLAEWEASLKDWTATSNELVGDAGMVRQLRAAIEADREGPPEGYEEVPLYRAYERLRIIQEYAATTTGTKVSYNSQRVWHVPPILMPKIPARLVPTASPEPDKETP